MKKEAWTITVRLPRPLKKQFAAKIKEKGWPNYRDLFFAISHGYVAAPENLDYIKAKHAAGLELTDREDKIFENHKNENL